MNIISNTPTEDELIQQEATLIFDHFNEDTALAFGTALVDRARAEKAPVVINIRTPDRTLFHAALPGSAPDNDRWAYRKSNMVLRRHNASLLVGLKFASQGKTVSPEIGFDPLEFTAEGGSFPIRVANTGIVGAVTVSGLASADDHAMIVVVLREFLGKG